MKVLALFVFVLSIATAPTVSAASIDVRECDAGCLVASPSPALTASSLETEVVKGRCTIGCRMELAVDDSGTEDQVNLCVQSCQRQFEVPTLSVEDCRNECLNRQAGSSCINGCSIYDVFIRQEASLSNDTDVDRGKTKYVIEWPKLADNAYLLRIRDEEGNRTVYKATNTNRVEIDLSSLICFNISVSYATLNIQGVSQFSPPKSLTVQPGPPRSIATVVVEDLDFYQHAIVTFTWDKPLLYSSLCHYELSISVADERSFCQESGNYTIILDKEQMTHLVRADNKSDASSLPLYDCSYKLTMRSFPGGSEEVVDLLVKYSGQDQEPPIVTCKATFDPPSNTYNITATWVLHPLAVEAVSDYYTQLERHVGPNGPPSFLAQQRDITELSVTYTDAIVLTEMQGKYRIGVTVTGKPTRFITSRYFYRRPIIPGPGRTYYCRPVSALPIQPSIMTRIAAENLTHLTGRDVLELSLSWEAPEFANGELVEYELYVGLEILQDGAVVNISSGAFKRKHIEASRTMYDVTLSQFDIVEDGIEVLFLQMRSKNNYDLISDWSSPIVLNISQAEMVTEGTPMPPIGRGGTAKTDENIVVSPSSLPSFAYALFAIGTVIAFAVLLIPIIVCAVCTYRHRFMKEGPTFISVVDPGNKLPNWRSTQDILQTFIVPDQWEVDEAEVKIFEPIGKGCFGEVFKGALTGRSIRKSSLVLRRSVKYSLSCTVAVKKLKQNCSGSEKANFFKEIEMMKKVSETKSELCKFVVNMVGCVTVKEPMLLLLEFVKHGDLLSYLRSVRKKNLSLAAKLLVEATPYIEPVGAYSQLAPKEDRYEELGDLDEKDLLEFSRQIAAGMDFLASLDIVHRDLACRNILVGEKKNLKISDFGMSRYVPTDEVYVPTSHGLLPLRWMAIESLLHREFTTSSDVWSYGIVLWEICTMGAFPYPNHSNKEIAGLLRQGYRMAQPDNCSVEVYNIMLRCWNNDSDDRPKFSELHSLFDQFLSVHIQDRYPYMELEVTSPYSSDRLVPETGQVSSDQNSFVNLDLDNVEQLSVRSTENLAIGSPPVHNRLSALSTSFQNLSTHSSPHSSVHNLDHHSLCSLSMTDDQLLDNSELVDMRYVQSPVEIAKLKFNTLSAFEPSKEGGMSNVSLRAARSLPYLQVTDQDDLKKRSATFSSSKFL